MKKTENNTNNNLNIFKKKPCILSFIATVLLMVSLSGCQRVSINEPIATKTDIAFDTIIQISIYQNSSDIKITKKEADDLIEQVQKLCHDYDNLLSKTKESSDIYKINHGKGKPVTVNQETFYLIEQSLIYSRQTDGLIDISVSNIKDLWDFSSHDNKKSTESVPSKENIEEALKQVDYKNILLDKENLTVCCTNPKTEIDLGFIAKGYIADQIKAYLSEHQIENAIINLGGNVVAMGQKPSGEAFIVGIKEPFSKDQYIEKVSVKDCSVVTSGIYERFFQVDSNIYHHIINPKTGYPADTDLLSTTIISDSSMKSDALSTACILLGSQKAAEFIKAQDNVRAVFVTKDLEIIKIN